MTPHQLSEEEKKLFINHVIKSSKQKTQKNKLNKSPNAFNKTSKNIDRFNNILDKKDYGYDLNATINLPKRKYHYMFLSNRQHEGLLAYKETLNRIDMLKKSNQGTKRQLQKEELYIEKIKHNYQSIINIAKQQCKKEAIQCEKMFQTGFIDENGYINEYNGCVIRATKRTSYAYAAIDVINGVADLEKTLYLIENKETLKEDIRVKKFLEEHLHISQIKQHPFKKEAQSLNAKECWYTSLQNQFIEEDKSISNKDSKQN